MRGKKGGEEKKKNEIKRVGKSSEPAPAYAVVRNAYAAVEKIFFLNDTSFFFPRHSLSQHLRMQ